MPIDNDVIIGHFQGAAGYGRGRLLHNAACYLMRMILKEHAFADMEELTAFCGNPDSLRAWLPTETDRIIFAEGLVETLRDLPRSHGRRGAKERRNACACKV